MFKLVLHGLCLLSPDCGLDARFCDTMLENNASNVSAR